jgi:L-threonylcarbamoyladenylate synthase
MSRGPLSIDDAAAKILAGEVVAFPTETVYGLGANAWDEAAVKKIFQVKSRPSDNPIIVHVASWAQVEELVDWGTLSAEEQTIVKKLTGAFWPGPLTLVLPKSSRVSNVVTAGLPTVTVRWPAHPTAQELIEKAGVPIAAPSANVSGGPSATTAEHVRADFGADFPVIDGGATEVGVESTVLDPLSTPPAVLRPGQITVEDLRRVLPAVVLSTSLVKTAEAAPRSPGQKYRHYAPKARVHILPVEAQEAYEQMMIATQQNRVAKKLWIVRPELLIMLPVSDPLTAETHFSHYTDAADLAHHLFEWLRDADRQDFQDIYIQAVPEVGVGVAVMDRVRRAAQG